MIWTEQTFFFRKFKNCVKNNYLKNFATYWEHRNWPIVLQKLFITFLMIFIRYIRSFPVIRKNPPRNSFWKLLIEALLLKSHIFLIILLIYHIIISIYQYINIPIYQYIIISLCFVDIWGTYYLKNILIFKLNRWQSSISNDDCNGIRTHNHLVRKRKLLWVRIPLQSLKLQISRLFRARSFLIFRQL